MIFFLLRSLTVFLSALIIGFAETPTTETTETTPTTISTPLSYTVDLNDQTGDTFKVTLTVSDLGPENAIYQFAAYHILEGIHYLDYMENASNDKARNYNTYALAPVSIHVGYDIRINTGVDTFQMITTEIDTSYIDYILPLYYQSNVSTKNGAIHSINQVMEFFTPNSSEITLQFREEAVIKSAEGVPGTYPFKDEALFKFISWDGPDQIIYYKSSSGNGALRNDYLEIAGDFIIDYKIPKVLSGSYSTQLRAEATITRNATIEIFLDGKKMGSNYNLTSGGTAQNPYKTFQLGLVEFTRYEEHTISVQSLIPGEFKWDFVRFSPSSAK